MLSAVDVPVCLTPNIAQLLWKSAAAHGDDVVIVSRDGDMTYTELTARAAAFAVSLRARGIESGDRVAIFLERGADAAAAFFGVAAVGGIAVIVSETLRPRQIEHICRHSSARLLIASSVLLARQPRVAAPELARLDPADVPVVGAWEPIPRVADDVVQLIYTSGSSGMPKGVTISHGNLWAGVQSVSRYLQLDSTDRIASLLSFSFDYGFNQLLCALWCGGALVIEVARIPEDIVANLRDAEITVLAGVPHLWRQILATPTFAAPIPSLRAMTSTGGRLPTELVRRMRASQPQARVFLMYGLTEAFRATCLPPDEVDAHPCSIGRAIPGSEVMVLRDDGTPCGPGEMGELVQRGPTVTLGYWNDPVATAVKYGPNPCRPGGAPNGERVVYSGDLVRADDAGRLYFVGRRDKLIKSFGHRVSPDEIVEVIQASGEALEAVVTTEHDGMHGEQIVAVIRLIPNGSVARLRAFCRTELPRHMQPARYQVETDPPRVPVDVAAIRAQCATFARE